MPKKTKQIEKINETEQGTGIEKEDSSTYRGDIKDEVAGEEASVGNVIPNNGTNEFTPVETHYKEGEQPAGDGSPHWELEEDTDAHPAIDADSREGLGGVSPIIRCCDKIPAVKDRNIKIETGYTLPHFPDITDLDNKTIGYDGGMNSAGETGHAARSTAGFTETDHPRGQARDDANAPVEYRCRYEVQPVGCENKYEYVDPCDCPRVYIWEYATDLYFGYADTSDGTGDADTVNHNTGEAGADFIADTITEQAWYKRDGTISVDMGGDALEIQRTLHEPQLHPAVVSSGTAVTDDKIGSAFAGVAPWGANGLYTKGTARSRPNQPSGSVSVDGISPPGFTGTDTPTSQDSETTIPAVGGTVPPQVGYFSLRAENLTRGCEYIVGVTFEIVHEEDAGGTDPAVGAVPTKVCSYGGTLYTFTATDSVNYLWGQEDGNNHDASNKPAEPVDADGREILPRTYKCVTPGSNFFQIPFPKANATSGCGGRARNDGWDWEDNTLNLDEDGDPIPYEGGPSFEYRASNFTSDPMTREHEYIVYISGLFIQPKGTNLGRGEVLPHYSHEDGIVQQVQQPVGATCESPPHAGGVGGSEADDLGFDFNTSDPPKKAGDPHP